MQDAVWRGDAKKVAELMRQDPSFKVNMDQDGYGVTLLHYACFSDSRSAVIPLLLAHPDIDVNAKATSGSTPFSVACASGSTSCVREMLKDSRVKVSEPNRFGYTPLWGAAQNGHLDVIKWWIASGREMHLGKPGDVDKTDAIGAAKMYGYTEVVTLLERLKSDPTQTRHAMRLELGCVDEMAAEVFALVVFASDGLLRIGVQSTTTTTPTTRFFSVACQLPLELQMVLCYRCVGSSKEIISGQDTELAFRALAKTAK